MQRLKHPQKLGDRLGDPDEHAISFLVLFEGWVEDLERFHASATTHVDADWELVVVDNPVDDDASDRIAQLDRVRHVPLREHLGYGAGRNLALRIATGTIACVVDTSVEITGPLSFTVPDDVALLGRWGVIGDGGYHYEESEGPDVDAVEAYFMAMRRADLTQLGLFDPKFRFYRNADLDFSYQARVKTGLRTVIDPSLPLERHEHRLWESTADRDELSRKNFFRFRQRWFE